MFNRISPLVCCIQSRALTDMPGRSTDNTNFSGTPNDRFIWWETIPHPQIYSRFMACPPSHICCFTYLWLHNKSPQNSWLSTRSIFIGSQFVGQDFGQGSVGWLFSVHVVLACMPALSQCHLHQFCWSKQVTASQFKEGGDTYPTSWWKKVLVAGRLCRRCHLYTCFLCILVNILQISKSSVVVGVRVRGAGDKIKSFLWFISSKFKKSVRTPSGK